MIFGTGETARQFYQYVSDKNPNVRVKYFLDSYREGSIDLNGNLYQVLNPRSLQDKSQIQIVVCTVFWDEVVITWQRHFTSNQVYIISNHLLHEISNLSRLGAFLVEKGKNLQTPQEIERYFSSKNKEIYQAITNLRFTGNEIDFFTKMWKFRKYDEIRDKLRSFPKDSYDLIIEGGTYDGAEVYQLLGLCKQNGNLHSFDLTDEFVRRSNPELFAIENWKFHQSALSQKSGKLKINEEMSAGSFFAVASDQALGFEKSTSSIQSISIDEFFGEIHGKKILIKLDVEGAEQDVIAGARKLMIRNQVDCLISIYHKNIDCFQIPKMLLECNNKYEFELQLGSATYIDVNLIATL